jgi:hypothetical protein
LSESSDQRELLAALDAKLAAFSPDAINKALDERMAAAGIRHFGGASQPAVRAPAPAAPAAPATPEAAPAPSMFDQLAGGAIPSADVIAGWSQAELDAADRVRKLGPQADLLSITEARMAFQSAHEAGEKVRADRAAFAEREAALEDPAAQLLEIRRRERAAFAEEAKHASPVHLLRQAQRAGVLELDKAQLAEAGIPKDVAARLIQARQRLQPVAVDTWGAGDVVLSGDDGQALHLAYVGDPDIAARAEMHRDTRYE